MSLLGAVACPPWCVTAHDPAGGEEDWVHQGEPLVLADGVTATLCMSVDPGTGERDGPYVLIADTQHLPAEAERLGRALVTLSQADPGADAAAGTRSPGP